MTESELASLTLASAVKMMAQGKISHLELRTAVFARIERLNPEMRAFITIMKDDIADATKPPLYGAPISVKDLFATKDTRTTAGAKVFAERIPRENATAVTRLKDGGAAIIGKTNMHEFAYGVTTVNPHFGVARNPWDPQRISGGSSGGSASAVRMGMGLASLGSDTGGSIRIPASLCGIVGLKPTYGRVSIRGMVPLSWSLDHAGPMARTVEDVAIMLGIVAGYDPQDPYSRNVEVPRYTDALTGNIKGVRVGVPKSYFYEQLSAPVENAVKTAVRSLERLGGKIVDVDFPSLSIHRATWLHIASPEAYSYHEVYLKKHPDLYGRDVRGRLEAGRVLLSIDYVRAQRARTILKEECKKVFETADVIVTPTLPITAPRIEDLHKPWSNGPETAVASLPRFTRFFNVVGLPAISVPCGFTPDGLPIGLQIAGRAFDESNVLRVAHAYEQDAKWFERHPTV